MNLICGKLFGFSWWYMYENPNNFECIIYNNNNVFSNTLYIGHYKNVNKLFTQQIDFVCSNSQSMLAKFWKIIGFFFIINIIVLYQSK